MPSGRSDAVLSPACILHSVSHLSFDISKNFGVVNEHDKNPTNAHLQPKCRCEATRRDLAQMMEQSFPLWCGGVYRRIGEKRFCQESPHMTRADRTYCDHTLVKRASSQVALSYLHLVQNVCCLLCAVMASS